jgi:hypothetical protein
VGCAKDKVVRWQKKRKEKKEGSCNLNGALKSGMPAKKLKISCGSPFILEKLFT